MNGTNGHAPEPLISGLAHVNLTIPRGTLDQAFDFYGNTLGLTSGKRRGHDENKTSSPLAVPVPQLQKGTLAWSVYSQNIP